MLKATPGLVGLVGSSLVGCVLVVLTLVGDGVGEGVRAADGMNMSPLFLVEKAVCSNLLLSRLVLVDLWLESVSGRWLELEDEEGDAIWRGTEDRSVDTSSKLRLYLLELALDSWLPGEFCFLVGEC